jgi:sugar phosphate isomerase/epimerase
LIVGRNVRWYNYYLDEVKFCIDNGFELLQVWYDSNGIGLQKDAGPLKSIKEADFPSIIHAVIDLTELDEHIPKILEILRYLGHKEVIIHPVCKKEEMGTHSINKLSQKVGYALEVFGNDGITVYLENNSKLDPIFQTIEEIRFVFSENPQLEFLIDLAHIDNYKHLQQMVEIKMPKILHVSDRHLEEIHEHLPLGKGNIDFKIIFKDILADFNGKIIFELAESDENIKESKAILDNILRERLRGAGDIL